MTLENNNQNQNPPAQKSAVPTIIVISLVILALAGVGAWFLFFHGGNDADERTAYDNIIRYENTHQLDSLEAALNEYFDTYNSDAFHYSQLKDLHDRFFTERDDWRAVEGTMTLQAVRHFLDLHPDGFYLNNANQKYDSLSFAQAVEDNTREAFEQYINQFSRGKYLTEARKLMLELDNEEISVEEKAAVKETLTAHFDALGDNDKGTIEATLAAEINSYIGKANPELEDIYAYMSNMHSSGRTIVFNVKNLNVTKVNAGGRNLFNAQFSLEEETFKRGSHSALDTESGSPAEHASAEGGEVQYFSGTAVLNEGMKITSLVLRKAQAPAPAE